jgi:hypothetical protein
LGNWEHTKQRRELTGDPLDRFRVTPNGAAYMLEEKVFTSAYKLASSATQHGITMEKYDTLLLQQGGKCAICRKTVQLSIDHDHNTGKVRGLLCKRCNSGLGFFADEPERLQTAIDYLTK